MIRLATIQDWDAVSSISRRLDYIDYINWAGPSYMDDGEIYVFEEERNILAFAKLNYLEDGASWLSGLRVDPDHQRKGIGIGLMEELVKVSVAKGLKTFRTLVFNTNYRSLSLFEKLGCSKAGEIDFSLGLPVLDGFHKSKVRLTGYVNSSWMVTNFTESDPLLCDVYSWSGWEIALPDERTAQILRKGKTPLKIADTNGFTCSNSEFSINGRSIFDSETEQSRGFLLERNL